MKIHFGKWRENANSFDRIPPCAPEKGNINTKFVFCIFYSYFFCLLDLYFFYIGFLSCFLSLLSLGALTYMGSGAIEADNIHTSRDNAHEKLPQVQY